MKISKNVATGMMFAGALAGVGSVAATIYSPVEPAVEYYFKSNRQLHDIERKLPVLEQKLVGCVPVKRDLPTQDCVDLKVEYDTLRQRQVEIPQSEAYKNGAVLLKESSAYGVLSFGVGFSLFVAGYLLSAQKKKEESNSNDLIYQKQGD